MSIRHEWLPNEIICALAMHGALSLTDLRDHICLKPGQKLPSRSTIKRHVNDLIEVGLVVGAGRDVFHAQTYECTPLGNLSIFRDT